MIRRIALLLAIASGLFGQQYAVEPISSDRSILPEWFHEDTQGRLWIGAQQGLFRFDGRSLVNLSLAVGLPPAGASLMSAAQDGSTFVCAGTNLYGLVNNRAELVAAGYCGAVGARGGYYLLPALTGERALAWLDAENFGRHKFGALQRSTIVARGQASLDRDGSLWFACEEGICQLPAAASPGSFLGVRRFGDETGLPRDRWLAVLRDRWGNIWARSTSRICRASSPTERFEPVPATQSPGEGSFFHVASDGAVWAGGVAGIMRFADGESELFPAERFGAAVYHDSFEDSHGDLWVGVQGSGVVRIKGHGRALTWNAGQGLTAAPLGISRSKTGSHYAATMKGVFRLSPDERRWELVHGTEDAGWRYPQADGDVLKAMSSAWNKILNLRGPSLRIWDRPSVDAIELTYQGKTVAFLTGRFQAGMHRRSLAFPHDPIKLRAIERDTRGILWLAALGGLFAVDGDGAWRHFSSADGLRETPLQALGIAPDGSVWIGYDHAIGISQLRLRDLASTPQWRHFPSPNDSYGESTFFFGFDRAGRIWRGTGQGVLVSDGVHTDPADWIRLTTDDGLIHDDTTMAGFYEDDTGVWICTAGGLTRMSVDEALFAPRQAGLFVATTESSLDAKRMRVSLGVSPLSLTRSIQLEYRILPQQTRWQPAPNLDIDLSGLPRGKHQLEARIVPSRRITTSTVLTHSFEVPGTALPWRWLLVAILIVLLVWLAVRWKRRTAYTELRTQYRTIKAMPSAERAAYMEALPARSRQALSDIIANADGLEDWTGSVVGGRYLLEHLIAPGGFGMVYFGRDLERGREAVAVKLIACRPELRDWLEKRWLLEQRALETLRHPGIVGPRSSGRNDEQGFFIATDYVEGVTLRSLIGRGPLEVHRACARTEEICDALAYAHARGVLHCDLKPDNVMFRNVERPDEHAVIIDFGTAVFREGDKTILASEHITGALDYMAPEQLGGKLSAATDVYSLAAVVFEMLTGVRWRHAESTQETLLKLKQLAEAAGKDTTVAANLEKSFRRALAYEPSVRPQSALEFARSLVAALFA